MKSSVADTSRGRRTDVSTVSTPPPRRSGTGRKTEKKIETGSESEGVKEVLSSSKEKFESFACLNVIKRTLNQLPELHAVQFWLETNCDVSQSVSIESSICFCCLTDDRGNSQSRSERGERSERSMRDGWSARLSRGIRRDEPLTPQHHPKGQLV